MVEVVTTNVFDEWLGRLRDRRARSLIQARIDRVEEGNLGDHKFFSGIGELRIAHGPGYRVYFVKRGDVVVILLCGGDKGSQDRDIKRALEIAKEV
ncbi:type II toxin-antitoxin system RelE/ParE family toxin [Mesorhizobium sp. UC22_110]|uniref:type II toxin-antitoxin system RelE/ParE family toxin n=1 Tax=unclassified Mesorhizobium TaxID=325217 RepID=UPI00366C1F01